MQTAIIIILILLCAALIGYLVTLERGMRRAGEQVKSQMENRSTARIAVPCPSPAAEELFQAVNKLMEQRLVEGVVYRRKEQDLRRQIANVSHDLRTPLTSILGYLQLLEREDLSEEQRREYLAVVESRARTLQTLITAFYDLSRAEGGEWKLEREPVDLSRELSDQLAAAYEQLEGAGIRVSVDIEPDLPPVWGDRNAVVRVLSNLLTNALKHGSDHLNVSLRREGDRVVSAFSNGAPDMTDEDADHVFERFYTADRTRTGRNTGLGMAIVKALTEQMGHEVSADLQDGEFTVTVSWKTARA
ncbi:MAG: sensor histidine kinase [Oscillospiraceae bacterium]